MYKDFSGLEFNGVKVLSFHGRKNKSYQWKCLCSCGKEFITYSSNLQRKKVRSCGCKRIQSGKKSHSWKGIGDIPASFLSNIKSQAKYRKLEFNLTLDYIWDIFLLQQRKCKYTGLLLDFTEKYSEAIHNKGTASLDRIDSSKGYIIGNVQWVHKDVNFMKQNLDNDKFFEYIDLIYNHCIYEPSWNDNVK